MKLLIHNVPGTPFKKKKATGHIINLRGYSLTESNVICFQKIYSMFKYNEVRMEAMKKPTGCHDLNIPGDFLCFLNGPETGAVASVFSYFCFFQIID